MYFVWITIINADCPRNVMLPRLDGYWQVAKIDYNNYNYNYYNYNNIYAYSHDAITRRYNTTPQHDTNITKLLYSRLYLFIILKAF